MGFFNKNKTARNDYLMRSQFNRVAYDFGMDILRSVDGSNADEVKLLKGAMRLCDLAGANALRQITASCLLSTCNLAVGAVDLSNEAERAVYYDAMSFIRQFEDTRALCA
jgi:hypothetical protein